MVVIDAVSSAPEVMTVDLTLLSCKLQLLLLLLVLVLQEECLLQSLAQVDAVVVDVTKGGLSGDGCCGSGQMRTAATTFLFHGIERRFRQILGHKLVSCRRRREIVIVVVMIR